MAMDAQKEISTYYLSKEEPVKSCLLAARDLILRFHPELTEAWKYRMPFFCYHGKMFCYLWIEQKTNVPYIGIVEGRKIDHPKLIQQKRSRMKIFYLDPAKDLPVKTINSILKTALTFYK